MATKISEGRILFPAKDDGRPREKLFINERQTFKTGFSSVLNGEGLYTLNGTREVREILGGKYFDFPKPTALLKMLLAQTAHTTNSIVLDFFAGCSTTAQAVLQLNAEDGGSRRFVMVQLPEPTPQDSDARTAGYATIAEVSRKRIELSGEKVRQDVGLSGQALDIGFRAYRLDDTNFTKWRVPSDIDRNALEQHLFSLRDSSTDEATPDDLLIELLLKQGYSLTEKITPREITGLDIRMVGDNLVLAYLTEQVKPTLDQLRALVDEAPARIIVLEDAFQGDDELKTNLAQLCKSKGIELWTA